MVKKFLNIAILLFICFSCIQETKVNDPLEEIVLKVGEEKIIDFFELGITTNACNYTITEKTMIESLIPIKHISINDSGLNEIHVRGKIRGYTQLKLEYEKCNQDPFLRKKYIQYIQIRVTEYSN